MPSSHKTSDVMTLKFFQFVAVGSSTADSSLLQPTECVHTTPSHVEFPQCCALIHMHNIGSSLSPHSFHVSSHLHGSCVLLCVSLIASTSHFFLISSL